MGGGGGGGGAERVREKLAPSYSFVKYIIIIDSFYVALFSALEQTHCAHIASDSE